jgi:hypothetical protein
MFRKIIKYIKKYFEKNKTEQFKDMIKENKNKND